MRTKAEIADAVMEVGMRQQDELNELIQKRGGAFVKVGAHKDIDLLSDAVDATIGYWQEVTYDPNDPDWA